MNRINQTPGASEMSWGPGLSPPGVTPYRARVASEQLPHAPVGRRSPAPAQLGPRGPERVGGRHG